ncbi:SusD/RagB family nutrient-binding outer membrane lipoprotein [Mangrovibacterium marinum]|uniref:SusD/RagB family nutrient-binding outer membrane lipoprotein n=1 Tax=Mangrovibacterium marinum TaxID=1639118 RepID=UPI002A18D2EF|nr:SusD/RagB family nutrient-binding outer membrane lipoprotein [Mangrovibacterium marinum]
MKMNINTIGRFLIAVLISTTVMSCTEGIMDDINEDTNHTQDAPAKFILADVITSTAFSNAGGDINTYTSAYVEHEVGTDNQLYRAEHRQGEPSSASTFNNTWGSLYASLRNARIAIEKCSEGGSQEGNQVTKGIAEVLAAYNSALIADMFGNAPWSEAALPSEDGTPAYMTPKIDTQEEIYDGIMKYLDDAITDLEGTDEHPSGSIGKYDFLYAGNADQWTKFAYGLKARYSMHLLQRASDPEALLEDVLEYANLSFQSVDEQAAFAIYDATNLNPLFDFQWSRDGLAASESMSEKLIERNDPRLRRVFIDANWVQMTGADDEAFYMAPNGENEQVKYTYNTSAFVFSQTAPTLLLSYHEILFLKAEALCRLDRADEAESILKEAVVTAIANTEIGVAAAMSAPTVMNYGGLEETTEAITTTEAETYFTDEVLPLFEANPLKETMNQKYLAFFGASGESTECYNDIRRLMGLGENLITLNNPNEFPLRCPYGNDDTTTNPAIKEAYGTGQYVYEEPVWWAGGTR